MKLKVETVNKLSPFTRNGLSLLPPRTRYASYRPAERFRDVVLLGALSHRRNTALDSITHRWISRLTSGTIYRHVDLDIFFFVSGVPQF